LASIPIIVTLFIKGVVFSDRSPKPHFPELKHAYQWISISAKDLKKGMVAIKTVTSLSAWMD